MNARLRLSMALLFAGGMLAGCGRNPNDPLSPTSGATGGANDQAQVSQAMASAPELVEDGQYQSADQTRMDGPAGAAAAINPLYFFRNITSVDRQFEFAFADTDSTGRPRTAIVTVHKYMRGTFDIVTGPRLEPGVTDSSQLLIVKKPLADHWVRRILLRRVPVATDPFTGLRWRIAAASGVDVTSRAATTRILKLEIKTASRDTVIDDPLAFFRLRSVMRFEPGEDVTLTVTTQRSDDVVVLVRAGLRARFLGNGDGTHTLVWHAPAVAGLFHVGVNALANGTLFDDQAPYDSQAWIVPGVVAPTVLADFAP